MLSVPKSDNTGIADGQLSLDIGDLVSACSTEADLSQKVQALSISDKFAYPRQHSKPDPQFESREHSLEDSSVVLTMSGWTSISGCATGYSVKLNGAFCMPRLLSIVCRTLLARFLVHLSPNHFRHGRRNQRSFQAMRRPATTSALFNWQSS